MGVSIRRADVWAFELTNAIAVGMANWEFQSAGRMFGLLNPGARGCLRWLLPPVSIRRADVWAFEPPTSPPPTHPFASFNPPGGCLGF